MSFKLPVYHAPDFSQPKFQDAPNVQTAPVLQAGVAPENYHSTSMFPEYFKVNGQWLLAKESRMDSSVVLQDGQLLVVENRNLQPGDQVVLGRTEQGEDGIYLHANGFYEEGRDHDDQFVFRQGRSRETSYARDYDDLMELLRYEKVHGKVVWVMGPAFAFDADARRAMEAMVENGYVDGLMAGLAACFEANGMQVQQDRIQPSLAQLLTEDKILCRRRAADWVIEHSTIKEIQA